MQSEIEVKFVNVSFDDMRTKLAALGGTCEQPMRLMRRVAINSEFMKTGKDAYLRVRDEGDKVTMTYKQFDSLSVDGAKEIEGHSEEALQTVAEQLGFKWEDAVFGDVMAAYRVQYPHLGLKDTVATLAEVKFGDPLPEMLRP